MPQRMRIHTPTQNRREIKQLQAHGQYDPRDRNTGPRSPGSLGLGILAPTVIAPHQVRDKSACHIGGHIIRVIPPPQLQVGHVRKIHDTTQQRPCTQHRPPPGRRAIQPELVHGGIVQPIEHIEPRAQIIQLLRQWEIARVKHAAGRPASDAHVGERNIKGPQGVRGWDGGADFVQAVDVRPEVGGREEHGDGLLHAEHAREGPFAVELDDGLVGGEAGGGDDALAGVVAFGGAVPEE